MNRAYLLLPLLCWAPALSARADAPPMLAPEAREVLLSDVPHADGGVAWGRAETVLDASPAAVLTVLHDYGRYAGLFPYFEQSRVLSERGDDAIVYLEAKVLHGAATLWTQVRMSSRSDDAGRHVVEARMMKGKGNIGQLVARWEVSARDGGERTHVVFQLLVDPHFPVPDSLVTHELVKGAGKAVRALRDRVTQHTSVAQRPAIKL